MTTLNDEGQVKVTTFVCSGCSRRIRDRCRHEPYSCPFCGTYLEKRRVEWESATEETKDTDVITVEGPDPRTPSTPGD